MAMHMMADALNAVFDTAFHTFFHLQTALNATSTSNMAMHMMADALTVSAQEETNELLNILAQVG